MSMTRILLICLSLILIMPSTQAKYSKCVLIPFTDQTPYKKIGTNEVFSELVMYYLIDSGVVDIGEVITLENENIKALYDPNYIHKNKMESSIDNNDFNSIFDGEVFDDKKASDVTQARRGQTIAPELISEIGKKYGAEYIIQGNVLRIGNDKVSMDKEEKLANIASGAINALLGINLGSVDVSKYGISLTCDLKLIRTEDGKVVWSIWCPCFVGKSGMSMSNVKIGAKNADSEMFFQSVEEEAKLLASGMIAYLKNERL